MNELHQYASIVGLVVPALLGALNKWLNPSPEARYLMAVLLSGGIGVGLLALMGEAIDLPNAAEAIIWVWGVSQLTFKGQQAARAVMKEK